MHATLKIGIEPEVIKRVRSVLKSHPEVTRAVLFGSRAKGNFKPFSDIDITLMGDGLTLTIQQKIENEIDDLLLPYKFDLSIFHQIKNQDLVDHINRVGKILYDLPASP
jgi:predicted nucleotidyltransferase